MELNIYNNSQGVNPIFVKANTELLNSHRLRFDNLPDIESRKNALKELWVTEYGATLIDSEDGLHWICARFLNQKCATMFFLKWT